MEINVTIKIDDAELKKLLVGYKEETDLNLSDYARFFDDGCKGWSKDPEYNLFYLKQQERYCNSILRNQGYLFLNDVYDLLGIPRTRFGSVVGWIYDEKNPNGDNYVSFDIYNEKSNRDFINGYRNYAVLDFNVDGEILSKI